MSLSNYAGLAATIQDFLNRQDLASAIPGFISLAEARFNRSIRVSDNLVRVMTNVTTQYTTLPPDFRELKFVKLISTTDMPLQFVDQRTMVECHQDYPTAGRPKFYSLISGSFEVCPVPDSTYLLEIGYYSNITGIDPVNNTSNWLLTKHPDLYLYGALVQSAPYLKDDERLPVWRDFHDSILESIRLEDERANYSGGTLRVNAKRIG